MSISTPLRAFYCYVREDKAFRDALDRHLSGLKQQKLLITWSDQEIRPGEEVKKTIDTHLQNAQIIFCLISPDFLASGCWYEQEMQRALDRCKKGANCIIPIVVRPTYWANMPLAELQVLPSNAQAVTLWPDFDAAWLDVVKSVVPTIQIFLLSHKEKEEEWLKKGENLVKSNRFVEALHAYERAIELDPNASLTFRRKSKALNKLQRYQEALEAFEHAIKLDPDDKSMLWEYRNALKGLKRYQEALESIFRVFNNLNDNSELRQVCIIPGTLKYLIEVSEQVMKIDFNSTLNFDSDNTLLSSFFNYMGNYHAALNSAELAIDSDLEDIYVCGYRQKSYALNRLQRYQEALEIIEMISKSDFDDSFILIQKGYALNGLQRYQEALESIEQATKLDFNNSQALWQKCCILANLKHYEEALECAETTMFYDLHASKSFSVLSDRLQNFLALNRPYNLDIR